MPSQEEYLDNLLRGMTDASGKPAREENQEKEPVKNPGESVMRISDLYQSGEEESDYDEEEDAIWGKGRIQVDDTAHMTVEDIERYIAEGESGRTAPQELSDVTDSDDLLDMLEHADDGELHEIHDILHKADSNIALNEEILAISNEEVEVFDPYAEEENEDVPQLTEKERRAQEKKRQKEEKRAQKFAKLEAERIARANKLAEEKAARKAAKEERLRKTEKKETKEQEKAKKTKKFFQRNKQNANSPEAETPVVIEETPETNDATDMAQEQVIEDDFSELDGLLQSVEEDDSDISNLLEGIENISDQDAVEKDEEQAEEQAEDLPEMTPLDENDLPEMMPLEDDVLQQEQVQEPPATQTDAVEELPVSEGTEEMSPEDAELMELLQLTGAMDMATTLREEKAAEKKETKQESEEPTEELEKKPKKKLLARIIDFLTEEDEEEEEKTEEKQLQLSDENLNILDELGNEIPEKGSKGKKKKGKKGDAKEAEMPDKKEKKEKKPKKEKVKKEKPDKKPKKEVTESDSGGSSLNKKKVVPVALACLTFGVTILLLVNLVSDFSVKKAGRDAYYNGDYETAFENLYGKKLNSSEQIMYSKSESILRIRLWLSEYQMFADEGAEMEALDSLIQSVNDYPTLYDYAVTWNAGTEVEQYYQQILSILADKYHLTESQALEIAAEPDDVLYTKKIHMIVEGNAFGAWDEPAEESIPEPEPVLEPLPDELPEEDGLGEIPLIDNL